MKGLDIFTAGIETGLVKFENCSEWFESESLTYSILALVVLCVYSKEGSLVWSGSSCFAILNIS